MLSFVACHGFRVFNYIFTDNLKSEIAIILFSSENISTNMESRIYKKCAICGVRRLPKSRIFLAKFPLDPDRCRLWVKASGIEDLVYVPIEKLHKLKFICGDHFARQCFNAKGNRLLASAVPTEGLMRTPLSDDLFTEFPLHIKSYYDKTNPARKHTALISASEGTSLTTNMTKDLKVLISSKDCPENGIKILQEHFTVVKSRFSNFGEEGLTDNQDELLKLIPGCSALVWISHHPLSKELLDAAGPQLKIVSTISAGYNYCNIPELKARGIKLTNTPNVLSSAVAEIAVALMLGAARRFTENLDYVHKGEWKMGFQEVLGQDLRGSTVGIVGLGGIGQATVKRLAGFEIAKFIYTGHREKAEGKALNAEFVDLDTLLAQSDFIVLAVPLNDETKHMINQTTLATMKKNAIIVNVGRGELIDQEALYDALKNGTIYAAGLDVTTPEPLPKDHKLLTLPNLFVLPHIGSATVRTRADMAILGANNIVNEFTGKPLITPVLP